METKLGSSAGSRGALEAKRRWLRRHCEHTEDPRRFPVLNIGLVLWDDFINNCQSKVDLFIVVAELIESPGKQETT